MQFQRQSTKIERLKPKDKNHKTMKKTIPQTLPASIIHLFFLIGLTSAFAFRSLIILTHTHQNLFRPLWYLGTIGYVLFFLYRFIISRKRQRVIAEFELIAKLQNKECLSTEERQVMIYILSSITKSREHLNYLAIFILSFMAIGMDIWLSM